MGLSKMKNSFKFFGMISVLFLVACISYTDPRVKNMEPSQVAVVELDISLNVLEIDGQKGPPNWLTSVDELKLPPGKHSLKVIWDNINIKTQPLTISVELEPGQRYYLFRVMDIERGTWSAKLERRQP